MQRKAMVPDWEEALGVIDDAMVLRTSAALVLEGGGGQLPEELERDLGRLANEAEVTAAFLGKDVNQRLRKYVKELASKEVRQRSPRSLVADGELRKQLYREIDDELRALPPAPLRDEAAAERTLRNTLERKLTY